MEQFNNPELDNPELSEAFAALPDLSFGEVAASEEDTIQAEPIIALEGEDLERFLFRFQRSLSNSKAQMATIHSNALRDRKIFETIPKIPLFPDGPDITSPLSADRAEGLIAHISAAIQRRPLARFTAEGIGKAAEQATEIAPIYEAYFEREINRGGSRELIASSSVSEAIITGTCIMRLGIAQHPDEFFVQVSEIIRLENFFVDRIAVNNLRDTFCAYRYKERMYRLTEQAEGGMLDQEAVESLANLNSDGTPMNMEEAEVEFSDNLAYMQENTLHTLYKGYMRFRPTGESETKLYECIYFEPARKILALRENPVKDAFDAPPIAIARIGKRANNLFGRGIIRRLEGEQKISDNGINTHLAVNNTAAGPPILYNANNPIAQKLAERKVLAPNMWIPNYGPPDQRDIMPVQLPNPMYALKDYDLAQAMAERRTYTDQALGQSDSTRKTLGQFRTEITRGTLKLGTDLNHFAYDMAEDLLKKMWAMVIVYKITAKGIVEVEPMGKLLGGKAIDGAKLQARVVELGLQGAETGQLDVNTTIELEQEFNGLLTNNKIPSARRQDITISLNGSQIITDILAELDTEVQILGILLNLLPVAKEDTYVNYWGRIILTKAGFKDIDKRWPQDPGKDMPEDQRREAMQPFNEFMQRSSVH